MTFNQTLDFDKQQSGTVVDIRSGAYVRTLFLLWANDRAERVDKFLSVVQ
jgi:hypothetical protein